MAVVERYTPEVVRAYVTGGYWTPEYAVDFWRRNARAHPDGEALSAPDGRYTWAQAAALIESVAAGLLEDGWRRDDRLLLQAPNSAALLILRLACEAAGVVSVLVPPTFARSEIEAVVDLLAPRGVAVAASPRGAQLLRLYESLAQPGVRLNMRYSIGAATLAGSRSLQRWLHDAPIGAAHAALLSRQRFGPYEYPAVVTTSGTTGTPKCVEHSACARLAAGRQYLERLRLTGDDVICGFTSIFSGNCDLVVYHTAPQVAAKIVLVEHFTPEEACLLMEREKVTGAVFVPTLLHRLLSYARLGEYDLSNLRFVTSFGAMLAPELAQQAELRLGARVIQGYGASEYGSLASTAVDDPENVRRRGIGRPLAGTEIEVRDADGTSLPKGRTGRIYARGPYCVGGFVGDQVATREVWRTGFCAMGDLGRIDAAGYLWLEGRARDVIIRGGQNIIPLEIEDALLRHPAVHDVAVVAAPDEEMGERVCAFVVLTDGATISLEELQRFLLEIGLAKFKLPERLELALVLPMNPAGTKVDKRCLQERLTRGTCGA